MPILRRFYTPQNARFSSAAQKGVSGEPSGPQRAGRKSEGQRDEETQQQQPCQQVASFDCHRLGQTKLPPSQASCLLQSAPKALEHTTYLKFRTSAIAEATRGVDCGHVQVGSSGSLGSGSRHDTNSGWLRGGCAGLFVTMSSTNLGLGLRGSASCGAVYCALLCGQGKLAWHLALGCSSARHDPSFGEPQPPAWLPASRTPPASYSPPGCRHGPSPTPSGYTPQRRPERVGISFLPPASHPALQPTCTPTPLSLSRDPGPDSAQAATRVHERGLDSYLAAESTKTDSPAWGIL